MSRLKLRNKMDRAGIGNSTCAYIQLLEQCVGEVENVMPLLSENKPDANALAARLLTNWLEKIEKHLDSK